MTCQKAIDVAKVMKKEFGEDLDLAIYTNDSQEAEPYDLKASTTVFVDTEWIPLDVVTSNEGMEEFLKKHIS